LSNGIHLPLLALVICIEIDFLAAAFVTLMISPLLCLLLLLLRLLFLFRLLLSILLTYWTIMWFVSLYINGIFLLLAIFVVVVDIIFSLVTEGFCTNEETL
jgi:hypothetical protein